MKILPSEELTFEAHDTPTNDLVGLYKVCHELKDMCIANQGKGLSAVQVGIPWNLFVAIDLPGFLQIKNEPFGFFLNCSYEPIGDKKFESIEGCLSILDKNGNFRRFKLNRHFKIRVRGSRFVDTEIVPFDQILDVHTDAIVFQHEIDHATGKLINEIGQEIFVW